MIRNEVQLIKQNIYDLIYNTRINKNGYLFISIGLFFTYFVSNGIINTLSIQLEEMYYLRYIFKLMGVCLVIELSRRRLHDYGLSGKWIYLWLIISCSIYGYYMYNLFIVDGLNIVFFEKILLIELGVIFIPTIFLCLLPSNHGNNQYGNSSDQLISPTKSVGYLNNKITVENKNGLLEYMRDIYISQSFCFKGRAKRVEALFGIGSFGMIISLIVNLISILFMIKDETGIEILEPISIGIFYILYFYTILSILTLCIRRLHDSLYSGLWVILLLVPYLNIFIIYRIFVKSSWDIDSLKDIS